MVVLPSFDNSLSFRFDVDSLLKTNFKSSSSSMFEDYFRDILFPYFEFQKFNQFFCQKYYKFLSIKLGYIYALAADQYIFVHTAGGTPSSIRTSQLSPAGRG